MRILTAAVIAVTTIGLSACKEQPPSNVMFEDGNNMSEIPPPIPLNQAYAEPEAPVTNIANDTPAAPPPAFNDQQQIADDADATGMTARLPSDNGATGANETQPAAQ